MLIFVVHLIDFSVNWLEVNNLINDNEWLGDVNICSIYCYFSVKWLEANNPVRNNELLADVNFC